MTDAEMLARLLLATLPFPDPEDVKRFCVAAARAGGFDITKMVAINFASTLDAHQVAALVMTAAQRCKRQGMFG